MDNGPANIMGQHVPTCQLQRHIVNLLLNVAVEWLEVVDIVCAHKQERLQPRHVACKLQQLPCAAVVRPAAETYAARF